MLRRALITIIAGLALSHIRVNATCGRHTCRSFSQNKNVSYGDKGEEKCQAGHVLACDFVRKMSNESTRLILL